MDLLIRRGTVYLLGSQMALALSRYAIAVIVGRMLGPQAYGRFGVIMAIITGLDLIFLTVVPDAVAKYVAEQPSYGASVVAGSLRLQMYIALFVLIAFVFATPWLATWLRNPDLTAELRYAALLIPLSAMFYLYCNALNGLRAFGKQAMVQSLHAAVAVAAVVSFVWMDLAVKGALLGLAVAALVGWLVASRSCRLEAASGSFPMQILYRFVMYGFLANLAGAVLDYEDTVMVQMLTGDSATTGFFTAAASIADAPCGLYTPLMWVLLPSLSHAMGQHNTHLTAQYIQQALRLVLLFLVPTAFVLVATAPQVVTFLYASAYLPAASALYILPFGYLFSVLFQTLNLVLWASGRVWVSSLMMLGLVPVHFAGLLTLVPAHGIAGAALATTVTWLVGTAVAATYVYVAFHAGWSWRSLCRVTVASVLVYLPLRELAVSGGWLLPQVGAVYVGYFGLLWLLGEFTMGEMQRLKQTF